MAPIARGVVERCRRRAATKGAVVADIGPDVSLDRLALRQNRDFGVVAMQALGTEHMRFDQRV